MNNRKKEGARMSKQRSISSEQLLYILMNKREEENQKKGIIKKELKKDSCKILGLWHRSSWWIRIKEFVTRNQKKKK